MPFGQLVIGPPGAGKTTYCYGLQQFFGALKRRVCVVNLDPAATSTPYDAQINISELITLQDVMDEFGLGPNGGMLYCLEFLEANWDWLEKRLKEQEAVDYFVFDCPGQVEISTNHQSLKNIMERLGKNDYRLAAVHLTDAHHIVDSSKFIAVLLLSLRAMLQLELPHINVFSKIDLLAQYGPLPFNLDYYTQVQDLDYLLERLESETRGKKFSALNRAIAELVEEYGLVSFHTLAVEDKTSMARLIATIDSAIGYHSTYTTEQTEDGPFDMSQFIRPFDGSFMSETADVQERWLDRKEDFDEAERQEWAKEGQEVQQQQQQSPPKQQQQQQSNQSK